MVILDQALQKLLPRPEAKPKKRHNLLKRSTKPDNIYYGLEADFNQRLSREEREAVYLAARERIFGKEDKSGEATPGTFLIHLS